MSLRGPERVCGTTAYQERRSNDHCTPSQREAVEAARSEALRQIKSAALAFKEIDKGYFTPKLKEAYQTYFKLDVTTQKNAFEVARVKILIEKVAEKASTSKFVCGGISNNLFCKITNQPYAGVPPGRGLIHLCGPFFKESIKYQAATMIHEMFHQFGGHHINYLDETYCKDSEGLKSKELIRNPDQYMLFIGHLGNLGKAPDCF